MLPMCRLAHLRVLGEGFLIEYHVTKCETLVDQGLSLTVEYLHGDMSVVEVYKSKVKVHEDTGFGPEGMRKNLHLLDSSDSKEVLVM